MNPPKKRNVLALDGGGTRGFFTYQLLLHIKRHISPTYPLKDKFDMLVGTSAGAIVAASMGIGHLEHPDILQKLVTDGFKVFGTKNETQPLFAPVYTGIEKKEILHQYFGSYVLGDCKPPLVIVTCTVSGYKRVFTSWNDPNVPLDVVLDASSAAPTYFPPVNINGEWLMDGGTISNSPVDIAVEEVRNFYGKRTPFQILSIGTSKFNPRLVDIQDPDQMGIIAWFKYRLIDILMGVTNTNMVETVSALCEDECLVRIVANLQPAFDNISPEFQLELKQEAHRVWLAYESVLYAFFQNREEVERKQWYPYEYLESQVEYLKKRKLELETELDQTMGELTRAKMRRMGGE